MNEVIWRSSIRGAVLALSMCACGHAPYQAPPPDECDETCEGSVPWALLTELESVGAQSRSCYEAEISRNPGAAGRLLVVLRIDDQGAPCSVEITESAIDSKELTTCVTKLFSSRTFSAPEKGCVKVAVPLRFERDADGGAPDAPGAKDAAAGA